MMRFFRLHNFKKIILEMNLVRCHNLKRKDYDLKKSTNNNEKTTLFGGAPKPLHCFFNSIISKRKFCLLKKTG